MNKSVSFYFLLLVIASTFSSCTFTKIVVFFKPSINDHKAIFACDTICTRTPEVLDPTSESAVVACPKSLFVDVNSPENIPAIQEWVPKNELLKTEHLDEFLVKSKTTALVVIKNDSIFYEKYLNGGAKETPKVVFSVTKAITATLTAIAAEEGLLSIDQKVSDFLPEFGEDERKNITLRHLMGMVSGLNWNDFKNLVRLGGLYYNSNQQRFVVKNVKQKYEPGEHFAYKSVSTQILGICLEKATGKHYADYLEEKIWKPVGMEYNALMTLDNKKNHNARTFGGLAITARDMIRFGKLMLNDGLWEGTQIVPDWFVKELKTRGTDKWFGYSNCFWRNGYETETFATNQQYWAAGYGGQYIYVAPQENMVIVRTGSKEKNRWSVLLGRLASVIGTGKTDLTDTSIDYGEQFSGTYKNQSGKEMKLELLPEHDKYDRREWTWSRDVEHFKEGEEHKVLTQFDGISLGFKKQGTQTRMYYKVENGKVLGFYYNTWPMVKLDYFEKVQ